MQTRLQDFDGIIEVKEFTHGTIGYHAHAFLEFVYVVEGHAEHHLNGTATPIGPGDFFVINYQTMHAYETPSGHVRLINCLFLPELLDHSFADLRNFDELAQRYFRRVCGKHIQTPPSDRVFHDDSGHVKRLFMQMVEECRDRRVGYEEALRCLLSQIIIETVRKIGINTLFSPPIQQLVEAVGQGYNEQLSLSDFCRREHYSVPYISALFRREVGMTFTEYVQEKRIAEGCRLLVETRDSITSIALQVGYTSLKFFEQVFQRLMGMSPREYRRQFTGGTR